MATASVPLRRAPGRRHGGAAFEEAPKTHPSNEARIVDVERETRAAVRANDGFVAIDGEKIQDQDDLTQMMNNHRAGDSVKVTIYRGKKKVDVDVLLGEARQQV